MDLNNMTPQQLLNFLAQLAYKAPVDGEVHDARMQVTARLNQMIEEYTSLKTKADESSKEKKTAKIPSEIKPVKP